MITLLNKFDDGYIIQRKDVLEIIGHYISEDNLGKYIKDVSFDNNIEGSATYNPITGRMSFNEEKVLKYCNEKFSDVFEIFKVSDTYESYFINFYYLYTLFHEIEHAKQEKEYDNTNNKLYRYLYELCHNLLFYDHSLYEKRHSLFPIEIEAHNNGFLKAYQLLSYTKLPKRETQIMYLRYLYSLLCNYEKINCFRVLTPIDKLSMESKQVDIKRIFKLVDESRLSKIERFNLGVCVTPRELNSIKKEKDKIIFKGRFRK